LKKRKIKTLEIFLISILALFFFYNLHQNYQEVKWEEKYSKNEVVLEALTRISNFLPLHLCARGINNFSAGRVEELIIPNHLTLRAESEVQTEGNIILKTFEIFKVNSKMHFYFLFLDRKVNVAYPFDFQIFDVAKISTNSLDQCRLDLALSQQNSCTAWGGEWVQNTCQFKKLKWLYASEEGCAPGNDVAYVLSDYSYICRGPKPAAISCGAEGEFVDKLENGWARCQPAKSRLIGEQDFMSSEGY